MSEPNPETPYTGTDTTSFNKMSVGEKIGVQRAYGRENARQIKENKSDIKEVQATVTEIQATAKSKAKIDTERHEFTVSSLVDSSEALTSLKDEIQEQKQAAADEETRELKEIIAEYENGDNEKKKENKKLIYYIIGAVLVVIFTRHLGTIVKMLSGG